MKIEKIDAFGDYGIFIDDLNLDEITHDEWMELGKLHMKKLVMIFRNVKVDPKNLQTLILKWGKPRILDGYRSKKKYGLSDKQDIFNKDSEDYYKVTDDEREYRRRGYKIAATEVEEYTMLGRVSGEKDKNGDPLGLFSEGELLWHSNESANYNFTPGVSLLGVKGMTNSSTGFLITTPWYEKQKDSFRRELEQLVLEHRFTPGKINPGLRAEQDVMIHRNMCPVDGIELPLIIKSPGDIIGLHYSINTIYSIKGETKEESDKFFEEKINKTLLTEEHIYDHQYETDNVLLIFDNSTTLHRRQGDTSNRLAYRVQFTYDNILGGKYIPYLNEPFITELKKEYDYLELDK